MQIIKKQETHTILPNCRNVFLQQVLGEEGILVLVLVLYYSEKSYCKNSSEPYAPVLRIFQNYQYFRI